MPGAGEKLKPDSSFQPVITGLKGQNLRFIPDLQISRLTAETP